MKINFTRIVIVFLFVILIFLGKFYWQNLRGIAPAVQSPKEDIVKTLDSEKETLSLPTGFYASIFAENLVNPRVMIHDSLGNILVSIPSEGKVLLLTKGLDKKVAKTISLISNLNRPHGLALYCKESCKLYVAETDGVFVYDYDGKMLTATNPKKLFNLPGGGNHFTRTLLITKINGVDKLLISVGSSCNVCRESDPYRAKILSANLDGTDLKVFSSGLRNSVFMAENPITKLVWATEMARDLLGDDVPPDEINIIKEDGNYGWPICYGKNIHDTNFDKNTYIRNPCMEPLEIPSYIDIPAHSAPLGLAFIPKELNWPEKFKNSLFVAYHGSWNRSVPTGYKIVRYILDEKGSVVSENAEDFITGWLKSSTNAVGRPVDLLFDKDLGMFISDDKAGVIYLVSYKQQ